MKLLSTIFLSLTTLLNAHESQNTHLHVLNFLHIQDLLAVGAVLTVAFLLYKKKGA